MNGHDYPEVFDPIQTFNLADDPAYLEYTASVCGSADGEEGIPITEGLRLLGEVSRDESRAYIRAYWRSALRRLAVDAGLPFYAVEG